MGDKLNLGAGLDVRGGYVNHDIVALEGIEVVHDLNNYPWPWGDNVFDEILALDLLEHLDEFLLAMEEIHRILKPEGILKLKVPYWNSVFRHIDPTHKRGFHEATFHFFDPNKELCRQRHYYSFARFSILKEFFILIPFAPYFKVPFLNRVTIKSHLFKRVVGFFGNLFSNVILDLELELQKKPAEYL